MQSGPASPQGERRISAAKPRIAVWGHTAYNMLWFSLSVVGPLPSAGGFCSRIEVLPMSPNICYLCLQSILPFKMKGRGKSFRRFAMIWAPTHGHLDLRLTLDSAAKACALIEGGYNIVQIPKV